MSAARHFPVQLLDQKNREAPRNGWSWLTLERSAALGAGKFVSGGLKAPPT